MILTLHDHIRYVDLNFLDTVRFNQGFVVTAKVESTKLHPSREFIRFWMDQRGVSISRLSELVGVDKHTMSRFLYGNKPNHTQTRQAITERIIALMAEEGEEIEKSWRAHYYLGNARKL